MNLALKICPAPSTMTKKIHIRSNDSWFGYSMSQGINSPFQKKKKKSCKLGKPSNKLDNNVDQTAVGSGSVQFGSDQMSSIFILSGPTRPISRVNLSQP